MNAKEQSKAISLSAAITWIPLIPLLWFVGKPLIAESLAEDIKQTVQAEVAPINNAFVALLQRDINATRKDIAALKFRQRSNDEWTQDDAEYLADLEIQLDALEEAKSALQVDHTS